MPYDKSSMDPYVLNAHLARNIQSVLDEKGLTPIGWATAAGLSRTVVRDIMSGKTLNPTYRTLLILARQARVDVRRLTVGEDYAGKDKEDVEFLDLLHQLEPDERRFVLTGLKAQVDARD